MTTFPLERGTSSLVPTDPLYANQWHFELLGNGRRGIIETLWREVSGAGVAVGVYDYGVQRAHPDLDDNYDASRHVVINGVTLSGDPVANPIRDDAHGTAVAGIIGAARNGVGGVGVAWGSQITGVNIFDVNSPIDINAPDFTGFLEAIRQMTRFDVTNHSWSSFPGFFESNSLTDPNGFAAKTNAAFEFAIRTGRGGLGTNIVKSNGNDNVDANGEGLSASRYTISVNALIETGEAAWYSSYGANSLVSAPGGDTTAEGNNTRLVITTDLLGVDGYNTIANSLGNDDFTDQMNGTSAAAPMVSGVIALMLQANRNLGWRDVKNILSLTAFGTGSFYNPRARNEEHTWFSNGANNWNGGGMHFSEDFGFGNVDAFGAVRVAEAYKIMGNTPQTSSNEVSRSSAVLNTNLVPADDQPDSPVVFTFQFQPNVLIENIQLTLNLTHNNVGQLAIELVSPSGTVIQVLTPSFFASSVIDRSWVFGIEGLRGELSAGTWTLRVADTGLGEEGKINTVQMTVHGQNPAGVNDTYHFTDEYGAMLARNAARGVLTDTDGGSDWLNLAAVSGAVRLNLNSGSLSQINRYNLTIATGTAIEHAICGDGDDRMTGNALNNWLYGMRGSDTLSGGAGADSLYGGAGNDELNGDAGQDTLSGGRGDDLYTVDLSTDVIVEFANAGDDVVFSSAVSYTLGVNVENLVLAGNANINGIGNGLNNNLVGNEGNNRLEGRGGNDLFDSGEGNDTLLGGLGNDTLSAWGGNDVLNGGAGADSLSGGNGDDTYWLMDPGIDQIVESFNAGMDTVRANISYTLAVNVENLVLLGSAAINGTGNTFDNRLSGNTGDNRLRGDAGADTLLGGKGRDTLVGGSGNDTLTGGAGNDEFGFDTGVLFKLSQIGQDLITDFGDGDRIALDKTTFTALRSLVGNGFSLATEFASVTNDAAIAGSQALVVYNRTTGGLFYNANGAAAGLGMGGQFATFTGLPGLTANDFVILT